MKLAKTNMVVLVMMLVVTILFGKIAFASDDEKGSGLPLLAVLPLKGIASTGFGDLSEQIYQRVSTAFFNTKRFDIVERAQLDRVLGEGHLQNTVISDENSAVTLGKQLGVKTVALGSYKANLERRRSDNTTLYAAKIEINIRLVDVQTGKVKNIIQVNASDKSASQTSAIEGLLERSADKLNREVSNRFPLTGYVIKILNDNEALIDLGSKDGLAVGSEFIVVEYGEDIVHPVTGKILKGEKKIITEFEIDRVAEETAVAKISGKNVPIRIGLALESKSKEAGLWEHTSDFFNK